jgi:hypothetical protein
LPPQPTERSGAGHREVPPISKYVIAVVATLLLFVGGAQGAERSFHASVGVNWGRTVWGIKDSVSPELVFSLPDHYAGRDLTFRLCWVNTKRQKACISRTRTLRGTDSGGVIKNVYLRPTFLPRWTTFTWSFEGQAVARLRARVK